MPEFFDEASIALLVAFLFKLAGVLVLLFVAWLIANWAARLVRRSLERSSLDTTLTKFFSNITRYVILIIAVLACLGIFGVETTSFAAILGAAGLAIGLAFQGSLSSFSAGMMLLIFRPFKVGDVVNVGGQLGKVDELGLFTTQLDTFDNRRIIMPNGSIFGTVIENITHHPIRRVDVPVGTDYSADLTKTRQVLNAAIASLPNKLDDPPPQVFLMGLGGSSIDWEVRVWSKAEDFGANKEGLIQAIKEHLDAAGIGIPFPQMDVHVDQTIQAPAA
jgi:small conductance mechanosensitive channel